MGNYDIVLALLSCLETGHKEKKLVDSVLDHCESYFSRARWPGRIREKCVELATKAMTLSTCARISFSIGCAILRRPWTKTERRRIIRKPSKAWNGQLGNNSK
jgi:hypothetical protein